MFGRLAILETLLGYSADLSHSTRKGHTCAMYALVNNHYPIVDYVATRHPFALQSRDKSGKTFLELLLTDGEWQAVGGVVRAVQKALEVAPYLAGMAGTDGTTVHDWVAKWRGMEINQLTVVIRPWKEEKE